MITLTATTNGVEFTFTDSKYYLYGNGTIDVPLNSLSLVLDNSGAATFKKAASNDVFVSAPLSEFGMTKAELEAFYKENMVGGGVDPEEVVDIVESATSYYDGVEYDSVNSRINFKHNNVVEAYVDAAPFIVDGMVDNVAIVNGNLVITFNTDSGKQPISIPLTDIFNPNNYYDKNAIDTIISGVNDSIIEDEEVISSALNDLNERKLDASAYTPIDITNYYNKTEVNGLLADKQDELSAGRGIDITNDTISLNLPISAGTGGYSIIEGYSTSAMSYYDHAEGYYTYAKGNGYAAHAEGYQTSAMTSSCHAEGRSTKASGNNSHAEGSSTSAIGDYSHAEGHSTNAIGDYSHTEGYSTSATTRTTQPGGILVFMGYHTRHAEGAYTEANNASTHTEGYYTKADNFGEHASGVFNNSVTASTTFGDSGNTLFSVGNGTADNARHNAFEIRQNGDIYITKDGADVKLQDQLGGGSASSSITSGDTNAVQGGAVYDKFDEVESVTAAALNLLNTNMGGLKFVKLSQQEYDNLAVKDSSTMYIII